MKPHDYHTSITVDARAHEVFKCISEVAKWWNDEFAIRFEATWKTFRITGFVPDKKVVWLVPDCYLPRKNKKEWKGTEISFEIAGKNGELQINFRRLDCRRA